MDCDCGFAQKAYKRKQEWNSAHIFWHRKRLTESLSHMPLCVYYQSVLHTLLYTREVWSEHAVVAKLSSQTVDL